MNKYIRFPKFAQLRPKHCVLAGPTGTHNVCVGVYHENVKLMLNTIDNKHLNEGADIQLSDCHDCLREIMCIEPVDACHFNECESYSYIKKFKKYSAQPRTQS